MVTEECLSRPSEDERRQLRRTSERRRVKTLRVKTLGTEWVVEVPYQPPRGWRRDQITPVRTGTLVWGWGGPETGRVAKLKTGLGPDRRSTGRHGDWLSLLPVLLWTKDDPPVRRTPLRNAPSPLSDRNPRPSLRRGPRGSEKRVTQSFRPPETPSGPGRGRYPCLE